MYAPALSSELAVVPWDVDWGDEYDGYQPGSLPGCGGRSTFHRSLVSWLVVQDVDAEVQPAVRC